MQLKIGDVVRFTDVFSNVHNALVTAIHGHLTKEARDTEISEAFKENLKWTLSYNLDELLAVPFIIPSVNLVYVAVDKTISYGSSVPYRSSQTAHGFYWELPTL